MATQNNPKVTDYDFATGQVIERNATVEEIASWKIAQANAEIIRPVTDEA